MSDVGAPVSADDEIDPRCPSCSYSLRGLEGDPIRCPECGHENRADDLRELTPAEEAEGVRLQTLPSLLVGSAAVVVLGFAFCWWSAGTLILCPVGVLLGVVAARRLAKAVGPPPGFWWKASIFWLQSIMVTATVTVSVLAASYGAHFIVSSYRIHDFWYLPIGLAVGVFLLFVFIRYFRVWVPWLRHVAEFMEMQERP